MSSPSPTQSERRNRRLELIRTFWDAGVMQFFRSGHGTIFRIPERTALPAAKWFIDNAMGSEPIDKPVPYTYLEYLFESFRCADVLFLYVVCEGHLIVDPFRFDFNNRSEIPLFEAERRKCSPFRLP